MTAAGSGGGSAGSSSQAWRELTADYEKARAREDSLDRLVEWPAERAVLGDVTGRSILDLGCGNGGKLAELVRDGAAASAGVDVGGNFITSPPAGVDLIRGDLSRPEVLPELRDRTFDRIMFLQSFGYATADYTYRTGWNEHIALTKRAYTMSGLLNVISAAGLWIETTVEPHLTEEAARPTRTSRRG